MTAVWDAIRIRSDFISILAVIAVVSYGGWLWSRNHPIRRNAMDGLVAVSAVAAIVLGRLVWVLVESPILFHYPIDLIQIQSGIDLPTALLVFAVIVIWRSRRGSEVLRFAAVALPAGLALYGTLCLFRGDCYGSTGPIPLAVPFPQFHDAQLPIALYEALGLGFLAAALATASPRPRAGLLLSIAGIALIEFATEWGRVASLSRFTDGWRWGWLILAFAGLSLAAADYQLLNKLRTSCNRWRRAATRGRRAGKPISNERSSASRSLCSQQGKRPVHRMLRATLRLSLCLARLMRIGGRHVAE